MKTASLVLSFALCLIATPTLCAAKTKIKAPAAQPTEQKSESCRAYLLMDASSGDILSEKNSHEPLPPASMVKMMDAYVVFKRLREGSITLDEEVTTSAFASKIGGSQVYLKQGEVFKIRELLEALLVQSANDAAMVLAEHIGGSAEGFVEIMNAEAKNLGMKESVFYSPHGLPPAKGQKPDLVSANDLARLGRALITEFPESLKYTGKSESTFRDGTFGMRNHNHLVRTFPGCDGIKTGYYSEAGFGVTATATKGPLRMIAVVMGSPQSKQRDAEAAKLLASGFSKFRQIRLVEKGSAAADSIPLSGAAKAAIIPVTAEPLMVTIREGADGRIQKRLIPCKGLKAPVTKGTRCGELVASVDGKDVGRVPVEIAEDIPAAGFVSGIMAKIWQ